LSTPLQRICIVNPFQSGGGAEYQIGRLIDELHASGRWEIFYLAHHVVEREPGIYKVIRVGKSDVTPRFGYLMDAVPLYRALREIRPAIIYQRVACGFTGICAWYAKRHHIPMVWHIAHDTDVMLQPLDQGRNPVRRMLEKRSVEFGLRNASVIVAQTKQQDELLQKNYARAANAVVRNFHPEPTGRPVKADPQIVVWIANLKRWKRPEVFVRLARALADMRGVRFIMVGSSADGSGDSQWSADLMKQIESTENLRYVGHRSHDEVNHLLENAAIFVNTSTQEGFPNTFIQAWMRKAVVVSLTVDPDGVLGSEGVGIAAQSEERLASSTRQLLNDSVMRETIAVCAQTYAHGNHSLRNATTLASILENAVDRKAG
jgi:glycosyltransferase involved in cell wall biosynthesis